MADKIQIRRDTLTNWSVENPILSQGELGFDLTLKKMKVGDGSTRWNDLDYICSVASEFIYEQVTPSPEWVIEHDMRCYPGVTVIDSGNNQVEGSVVYNNLNKITISFSAQFSGKAILR